MSQVAEARWLRCSPRHLSECQLDRRWPHAPANLRSETEGMLRELAFVYQATRSIREAMTEDAECKRSTGC